MSVEVSAPSSVSSTPVVRRSGLSAAEFFTEYASKNEPVVITGESFIDGEEVTLESLRRDYGAKRLDEIVDGGGGDVGIRDEHLEKMPTLRDYFDALEAAEVEAKHAPAAAPAPRRGIFDLLDKKETTGGVPYLTNMSVPSNFPDLARRFRPARCLGRNWLESIGPGKKLAAGELFIGPANTSYGELHFDRYSLFVATYQIVGRKQWSLYPPSASRLLHPMPYPGDWYPHFSPIDDFNVDAEAFPLFSQAQRHEVVLEAGEMLFCPASWWHNTRNLTPSVSIAVRVANRANLVSVLSDYALSSFIDLQVDRYRRRVMNR